MKIYISADMEGITGVVSHKQTLKNGNDYQRAREQMTRDVNACVRAVFDAGATEVHVNDSHGSMENLILSQLDHRVHVISGYPKPLVMMEGIDSTFDAVLFVGYHARAGSGGVLSHTMSGMTFTDIRLNGSSVGETYLNALIAAQYKVPIIMISGCDVLEKEAKAMLPHTHFAVTKNARGRFAAECLLPEESQKVLYECVKSAMKDVENWQVVDLASHFNLEVTFKEVAFAELAAMIPGIRRTSGQTAVFESDCMIEVYQTIATMMHVCSMMALDI